MLVLRRLRWDHLVTEQILALALMLNPAHDRAAQAHMARLAGRLGFIACHLPLGEDSALSSSDMELLIAAAEPALIVIDHGPPIEGEGDVVGIVRSTDPEAIRRARARLDEGEDKRPLIVAVPLLFWPTESKFPLTVPPVCSIVPVPPLDPTATFLPLYEPPAVTFSVPVAPVVSPRINVSLVVNKPPFPISSVPVSPLF